MLDLEGPGADDRLAKELAALASPVRLALLRALRSPKTLHEIDLRVERARKGAAGRPMARQTVREHLDRLLEAGAVERREVEHGQGSVAEYQLNHQRLFAIAEAFRDLARLRPAQERGFETADLGPVPPPFGIRVPALVLVKGLEEGRSFDLTPRPGRDRWVIGRRRTVEVAVDFDPYVSAENSLVAWTGSGYSLQDLPASSNGTWLNFQALPKGGSALLRNGDVVGVGRTLLLLRA